MRIRRLLALIPLLGLLSFGRLPELPLATIAPAPPIGPIVVVSRPVAVDRSRPATPRAVDQHDRSVLPQACTYETASARRSEVYYDDAGRGPYPYGVVMAWSCASFEAMQAEFTSRWAAMQAEAAELRACRSTDARAACPWPRS